VGTVGSPGALEEILIIHVENRQIDPDELRYSSLENAVPKLDQNMPLGFSKFELA